MRSKWWRIKYYFSRLIRMDFNSLFKTIQEIHQRTGMNRLFLLWDMLRCSIRYGTGYVDYSEFEFYLLKGEERGTYLTTRISDQINLKFNDRDAIYNLEDKGVFAKKYQVYLGRDVIDLREENVETFKAFILQHDRFFAKAFGKMGGEGITYFESKSILDAEDLYKTLKENGQVIVEEFFKQHELMQKLSLKSVNTIRMITFVDDDKEPHLLVSALKGGTDNIMDNIGLGGMYTILNEAGTIVHPMIDQNFNRYTVHPNTNEPLIGFQVPFYKEAVEMVKEAALVVPEVRYVGWDVAIGENRPVLIEGNSNTGPFQLIPSLSDDKVGILPLYKQYMCNNQNNNEFLK